MLFESMHLFFMYLKCEGIAIIISVKPRKHRILFAVSFLIPIFVYISILKG